MPVRFTARWSGGPDGTGTTCAVLLVEDDTVLGAAVRDQIAADGHSVDWITRLDTAGDHLRGRPMI